VVQVPVGCLPRRTDHPRGNVVADGDFVANSFRLQGTHRGPFLGVAGSGKRIDVEGATILKFAGGKCVERWSQTDVMGIMRQIGPS
jgi:predicted ester cyclase